MNDDAHDRGHKLEAAAESTLAKWLSRFGVPALLVVIGWFLTRTTDRIETMQAQQGEDIAQVKADVRVLGARLDEGVIRQVESNSKRLDGIEGRVNQLERMR